MSRNIALISLSNPPSIWVGRLATGSITGIYTVLVEGDDFNEPVADAVRSILDGHIVLTRELADQGHYPSIDVLKSVSRLSGDITSKETRMHAQRLIRMLATFNVLCRRRPRRDRPRPPCDH